MELLVGVGFLKDEVQLIQTIADEMNVGKRCRFKDDIGELNEEGILIESETQLPAYPAVIVMNLDVETEKWKKSLRDLKTHPRLRSVPIVGLGKISDNQINEFYNLRGNSYLQKAGNQEKMTHVANTALKFWLEISQLPGKLIADA